ncbi:MAG: peptidylprolyl isomerase, partial [Patescibacteria group bacterium]|nr:peptidylprolyl isomerase [Patescibacteria group bacterium]
MTQKISVTKLASPRRRLGIIVAGMAVLLACLAVRYYWEPGSANAEPPSTATFRTPAAASVRQPAAVAQGAAAQQPVSRQPVSQASPVAPPADTVAEVNGDPISRSQLGQDCLLQYGEAVLESLVNKHLIAEECQRRGLTITDADVTAEIERMASRFKLPVDQWMKLLEEERGIKEAEYANDIIWPTLALRTLAGEQLRVTPEELRRMYETQYGEAIQARLIAVSSRQKAEQIHAEAVSEPGQFGRLAKDHSEDLPSAASMGMIQPIRKHGSYQEIEQTAFSMEPGDISPVIHAGGQYIILKKEGVLPARPIKFEQVAPQLEELIRDSKLRQVSQEVFRELQTRTEVVNVLNDPNLRQQMPGVAAIINGRNIAVEQLGEECVVRHGLEVLERSISRVLIEQACKKQQVTVTEADLDAEIAQAALRMLPPK